MDEPDDVPDESENEPPADGPVIDVKVWFQDRREVYLDLDGVRYRLRLTRRNKLILQK